MISSQKFLRNFSIIKFEFILLGYKSHFPRLCTQFQIRVQNNNYLCSSLRFSSFFCWNFFDFFASCAQGIISSEISFISAIISGQAIMMLIFQRPFRTRAAMLPSLLSNFSQAGQLSNSLHPKLSAKRLKSHLFLVFHSFGHIVHAVVDDIGLLEHFIHRSVHSKLVIMMVDCRANS